MSVSPRRRRNRTPVSAGVRRLRVELLEDRRLLSVDSFLIPNGDFESGDLTHFISSGTGIAQVVREGTCFSYNNPAGISFGGEFAANIRSDGFGRPDSDGILTSAPFVAGSALTFRALSENATNAPSPDPVHFEVRILDAEDNILLSQVVSTNIVTLDHAGPCSGALIDGEFSFHTIDTESLLGQDVRVQFRQHTNVRLNGYFTLVDDIAVVRNVLDVSIDIKPDSSTNTIMLRSNGVVPVAILSSELFDATTVIPASVRLENAVVKLRGNGNPRASEQDVNADGLLDLVVHVETQSVQLTEGDDVATLRAWTVNGDGIVATDSVRIVGVLFGEAVGDVRDGLTNDRLRDTASLALASSSTSFGLGLVESHDVLFASRLSPNEPAWLHHRHIDDLSYEFQMDEEDVDLTLEQAIDELLLTKDSLHARSP